MTREEYLELKEANKKLAKQIKNYKTGHKQLNKYCREFFTDKSKTRAQLWSDPEYIKLCSEIPDNPYLEYRANHIFLSLCRGKTREQIENKRRESYETFRLEKQIINLCEQYGLKYSTMTEVVNQPSWQGSITKVTYIERDWIKKVA